VNHLSFSVKIKIEQIVQLLIIKVAGNF